MKRPSIIIRRSEEEKVSSGNWFYIEEDFLRRIHWLVLWRLVFISIFLLLTVLLQEKEDYFLPSFSWLFLLIALQYFFSILYIIFLLWGKAIQWNALIQLFIDGLFVTAVVYVTGGIESFFSYLYFLVILAGGTLFYRSGGLLAALYVILLYGVFLSLQGLEVIPFYHGSAVKVSPYSKKYFIYQIVMNGIGFFFVGYLSSIFPEQTRKQRSQIEIQKKNIDQLEELNRIVIENLDIGLITLDYENKIQSINPAGEKILGRDSGEIKNQSLKAVFPEWGKFLGPNGITPGDRQDASYVNPKGIRIPLGFSFNQVKEGQTHGIGKILSFKDISQIKAMEEHLRQVDRLALMGKMAAVIAHEVRNPLASISGSIQVLKDGFKEEGTGERLLKIISREVTKLDSLMNDFLTFAKPVQEIEYRLNISDLIYGTVELAKKNREAPQNIEWCLNIEPNLIMNISAGELSQVLWNLLMNALQAVPAEGQIFIGAQHHHMEDDRDWIEIKVKDNGLGILESDRLKIFEPFFTTKDQGTGLGLSIVQKIISDRGGRIQVDSFPGQGTEFTVLFPKTSEGH